MLKQYGPSFIAALRAGAASKTAAVAEGAPSLNEVVQRLQSVVEEANRAKVPVTLGKKALDVFHKALQFGTPAVAVDAVVNVWASSQ